jgi:hypothetical protein
MDWIQGVFNQVVGQAEPSTGIPLANVTVADRLPSGLTFVSASNGGVYDSGSRTITWQLDGLDPGASATLTYTVTVNEPGYWTNSACAAGADPLGAVVSDCTDVTVTGGLPTPTPTDTPQPTATPTPTVLPTPTVTPTLAPGARAATPGPTSASTSLPSSPQPPVVSPTPTLTDPEIEVLGEVVDRVNERETGGGPPVPVQLPGP